MNEKEEMTDWLIAREECVEEDKKEETDLTVVYLKGYADAEEKYRNKIKELEDHLKKYYNGELYTAKQLKQIEENQKKYFIPVQKVKDKIKDLEYNSDYLGFEKSLEEIFKIEVLEELL